MRIFFFVGRARVQMLMRYLELQFRFNFGFNLWKDRLIGASMFGSNSKDKATN